MGWKYLGKRRIKERWRMLHLEWNEGKKKIKLECYTRNSKSGPYSEMVIHLYDL
jgi:hypothetical protein